MIINVISVGLSELHILQYIANLISEKFSVDVRTGKQVSIDNFEANERRGQYLSTRILESLMFMKNSIEDVALGIADVDLYVPSLNFVFGEADPNNKAALISITRLKPSFYGQHYDDDLLLERAGKEAVHELGHVFNLRHCHKAKCVMFFSNTLTDTDVKEDKFCDRCNRNLKSNLRNWRAL
jgi:archaemetzincin